MTDEHWWSLLKGPTLIYLGYGETHTKLYGTELRMRKGPPICIAFDLDRNLRSTVNQFRSDARDLTEGNIRRLTRVEIGTGGRVGPRLRAYLERADTSMPWHLVVMLRGEHRFVVDVDWREQTETMVFLVRGPKRRPDGPTR
jgi:hypothetical protein